MLPNRDYLSDTVLRICLQLNDPEADRLAGAVLAGSQLALDILDEGVTREYPNYARSFAQQAVRLLELTDPEPTQRLASVYADTLALTYQTAIERQLDRARESDRRAAWHLLFQLADRGVAWAEHLIEQRWKSDPDNAWDAIAAALATVRGPVSTRLATVVLPLVAPSDAARRERFTMTRGKKLDDPPVWFESAQAFVSSGPPGAMHLRIAVMPDHTAPNMEGARPYHVALLVTPCADETWAGLALLESEPVKHDAWGPLLAVARVAEAPSAGALARAVRAVTTAHPSGRVSHLYHFPWPVAACLARVRSGDDLARIEALAASGALGTPDDWSRAEARWEARGVSVDDIACTAEHGLLDARIAEIGGPVSSESVAISSGRGRENTSELLRLFSILPPGGVKGRLASITLFTLNPRFRRPKLGTEKQLAVSPAEFHQLVRESADHWWTLDALGGLQLPELLDAEWRSLCDDIGRIARPSPYAEPQGRVAEAAWFAFAQQPAAVGLLSVVGNYGAPSRPVLVPTAARDACITACAHENQRVRYGAATTLLWGQHWSAANAGAFATAVRDEVAAHSLVPDALWNGLSRSDLGLGDQTALLLAVADSVDSSALGRAGEFDEILQALQNARRSPLHTPAEWNRLALPDLGTALADVSEEHRAQR